MTVNSGTWQVKDDPPGSKSWNSVTNPSILNQNEYISLFLKNNTDEQMYYLLALDVKKPDPNDGYTCLFTVTVKPMPSDPQIFLKEVMVLYGYDVATFGLPEKTNFKNNLAKYLNDNGITSITPDDITDITIESGSVKITFWIGPVDELTASAIADTIQTGEGDVADQGELLTALKGSGTSTLHLTGVSVLLNLVEPSPDTSLTAAMLRELDLGNVPDNEVRERLRKVLEINELTEDE